MQVDITNIPFKMTHGESFFRELAEEVQLDKVDTLYSFNYKEGLQNLAIFSKGGSYKDRVEIIIKTVFANEIRIFLKIYLEGEQALYIKITDPKEHDALRTAFLNGTNTRTEDARDLIKRILASN